MRGVVACVAPPSYRHTTIHRLTITATTQHQTDLEVGVVALVDEELAVRHGAFGAERRQHLAELAEEEVAPHLREALVGAEPHLWGWDGVGGCGGRWW